MTARTLESNVRFPTSLETSASLAVGFHQVDSKLAVSASLTLWLIQRALQAAWMPEETAVTDIMRQEILARKHRIPTEAKVIMNSFWLQMKLWRQSNCTEHHCVRHVLCFVKTCITDKFPSCLRWHMPRLILSAG